jgi:hypothetical protein
MISKKGNTITHGPKKEISGIHEIDFFCGTGIAKIGNDRHIVLRSRDF